MLEEAIYKFKVSGPTIMPALFDNYFLKETEECNGYAILTYEVNHPLPIDEVLNIMDGDAWMVMPICASFTSRTPIRKPSRRSSDNVHVLISCPKSSVTSR